MCDIGGGEVIGVVEEGANCGYWMDENPVEASEGDARCEGLEEV